MSKEEILEKHYPDFDLASGWMFDGPVENVFKAMDEYAKQEAVEFFKFNAKEIAKYLKYLKDVNEATTDQEIERALNTFEGASIKARYQLYIESKNKKP